MNLLKIQSFYKRNVYSHRPVIRMRVDLGEWYDTPTCRIPGFNETLLEWLPGLHQHACSRGYPGGFAERLREGTYLAHVIEHIALELQCMLGYTVSFGRARLEVEPSVYQVIFEYMDEKCGIECGRAAFNIASGLVRKGNVCISEILTDLERTAAECSLGPSTRAIVEEALKRGIPVTRLGNESMIRLGYGKYSRVIEASMTDAVSCISVDMAGNKQLTRQILKNHNIPAPEGDMAYTAQSALWIAEEIGYPVVVKPYDANQGKGVTLNVRNAEQLLAAYKEAIKFSRAVVVERYIKGKDYRVLVVGDKVCAVSERKPPFVVGDGIHSVKELVDAENMNPRRGEGHEKPLTKIRLDDIAKELLKQNGLDENSIPALGETVFLRENGNLSTGGTARDCTDEIHPINRMLAVRAAKAVGLDIAGIDITAEDISLPIDGENGAVIEVNAAPGLRMHLYPTEGKPRNVASEIVDMLFPEGTPYTIPIVSVTGTNGKTTTTRLIAHILSLTGKKVGMTTTSGIFVDRECILEGDCTGPLSASMVLSHREVEAAVLETARGGILRRGLGYDLADVGVMTNIQEDHLGLDGVETLEDLAYIKALVLEAVKKDGYAVLNADDGMTPFFLDRIQCNAFLFSKTEDNPTVKEHIGKGGKAVYVKNGLIRFHSKGFDIPVASVKDIPITFEGKVECNIENALAAASAAFALDLPAAVVKKGLLSFLPDPHLNPGRFNIFDMGSFKLMLDYGHNPAGYKAVANFIKRVNAARLVGVIGVPGDRSDQSIMEVGKICGNTFSKVYIKEDADLRGRDPGEVADILYDAVIKCGLGKENIEIIYSETAALEAALKEALPGDFIVMFYENFEPALKLVRHYQDALLSKKSLDNSDGKHGTKMAAGSV